MKAKDSWDEVRRLRELAEAYARQGDVLGAAYCDQQASAMAARLRSV